MQDFTAGTLAGAAQLVVGHPFGVFYPAELTVTLLNGHECPCVLFRYNR